MGTVKGPFTVEECKADILKTTGYSLTEDQEGAIRAIITGLDVVACLPTGAGKSLIFQALALSCKLRKLDYVVIIVTPLKSISFTHLHSFKKLNVGCLDANTDSVEAFSSTEYNAVVANPEVLISQKGDQVLREVQDRCRLFVVDEAHCLKTWGEGATKRDKPFRKLFQQLANVIAKLKNRPRILCMSATMREVTDKCTRQSLGISSFLEIKKNPTNPRISFINTKGKLNVQNLAEMLKVKGRQCRGFLYSRKV